MRGQRLASADLCVKGRAVHDDATLSVLALTVHAVRAVRKRAGTNGRAPRDTLVCMVRATAPTTGRLTLRPFGRERLAKAAGLPQRTVGFSEG